MLGVRLHKPGKITDLHDKTILKNARKKVKGGRDMLVNVIVY
ncbi:MAG: hypothetical protein U9O96_04030 [Candidatus Thermoplasmatota archaeon]|nr:hypothetical protein [Candidatus Thermoplasmatota archaeon]